MSYDPQQHHRRSIRLASYDYATNGAYFVTLVTANRAQSLGTVIEQAVELSATGMIVDSCWQAIPTHFPHITLDASVVMPNHLHGILFFDDSRFKDHVQDTADRRVGARYIVPTDQTSRQFGKSRAGDLATVIRTFKAAVTRELNANSSSVDGSLWQRNYYEKIIRNERMLNAIREYIIGNPANWQQDEYHV